MKKTFQGASTAFVYDGWRCVAEYENGASASSPARDFVFGTYLDEPLMMVTAPAGAATKRYYHSDHLYSVYALTDAAGAVIERYRYEGYGKATVLTAGFVVKTDPNYSEFGNPWTYTGQRLDAETSLHYYKNRYRSVDLGRLLTRDLIGYADGPNLYEYVGSSPAFYTDPFGLACRDYGREARLDIPAKRWSIPTTIPGVSFTVTAGFELRYSITGQECPCCEGGWDNTSDISIKGRARLTATLGGDYQTEWEGFRVNVWYGARFEAAVSISGSAMMYTDCDGKGETDICVKVKPELKGRFGGEARFQWKYWSWSAGAEGYVQATREGKVCFKCNKDGCKYAGWEWSGSWSGEIGFQACFGACFGLKWKL